MRDGMRSELLQRINGIDQLRDAVHALRDSADKGDEFNDLYHMHLDIADAGLAAAGLVLSSRLRAVDEALMQEAAAEEVEYGL